MPFSAFLFETVGDVPSVEYLYISGILLAILVFLATYFHNQVGLIILFCVGFICAQDPKTPDIFSAASSEFGSDYVLHWNYSSRITFVLSVILFFTAIIIKRRKKRKIKAN